MSIYRQLADREIATLTVYGCSATDWKTVQVVEDFSPNFISNVHFSGNIKLGTYTKVFELAGGVTKHSGIYNCSLHNCEIGNDVFIDKINNYIANYKIANGTYIENVNLMLVDGLSSFGNGVMVTVLNEGGGREIPICDELSAPLAYMLTLYRHRPLLIQNLQAMIDTYVASVSSTMGTVGENVRIVNCGSLKNVRIGNCAVIEGASLLENGSINSNAEAPVVIGSGVQCNDFIVCSGASITESTLISRCFVGQGTVLGKHFSAIDSLFFANCQGLHGEATSVFAGPYTVSHHKATLLLTSMYSFFNAGSGSNSSNHMYKLGPVHQGICERGVKATSDSYVLWPARIGAFTLVMGRHYTNSDTSDLPFSYLIENASESMLVPGVNLRTVGTIRDAQKWPKRDMRKDSRKIDPINFNLLSPYTVGKISKGVDVLTQLQREANESTEIISYQNCSIKKSSIQNGLDLYNIAINKYLGNALISRIQKLGVTSFADLREGLVAHSEYGGGEWIDLSGLIAPKKVIDDLLQSTENNDLNLREFQAKIQLIQEQYRDYEWTWAKEKLDEKWNKSISEVSIDELIETVEVWKSSVVKLDELIFNDAKKEFNLKAKTGFGVDGDEEQKQLDFESVRGSFDTNSFVIEVLNHIKIKTELGNEIIDQLMRLK